eukprot:TRINITY_DN45349_c0_g1_i1.p1 TRINITY_DN45349_c0_g1~~TRINITY_DN45349_c0_g1_i1.p1  ORF type:complete len:439 (-),score=99.56 TRINITY_DN45349_c0_g1_i1:585-1901(-)
MGRRLPAVSSPYVSLFLAAALMCAFIGIQFSTLKHPDGRSSTRPGLLSRIFFRRRLDEKKPLKKETIKPLVDLLKGVQTAQLTWRKEPPRPVRTEVMIADNAEAAPNTMFGRQSSGDTDARDMVMPPPPSEAQRASQSETPTQSKEAAKSEEDGERAGGGRPGIGFLELVVAWHCEDDRWFRDYAGAVAVYSKQPGCSAALRKRLQRRPKSSGPFLLKNLPNVGREGHSYIKHILDNYDTLATYTAFTQGSGEHNGAHAMQHIRAFLGKGKKQTVALVPITPLDSKGNPALYRDADKGDDSGMDTKNNILVFPYFGHLEMANRAREMYLSVFGGDPCTMPPMIFVAGAQMIVHRDAIRSKSREWWKHIYDGLADCFGFGWDWERLWIYAFDLNVTGLSRPRMPGYCANKQPHQWKTWTCKKFKKQKGQWFAPSVPRPS